MLEQNIMLTISININSETSFFVSDISKPTLATTMPPTSIIDDCQIKMAEITRKVEDLSFKMSVHERALNELSKIVIYGNDSVNITNNHEPDGIPENTFLEEVSEMSSLEYPIITNIEQELMKITNKHEPDGIPEIIFSEGASEMSSLENPIITNIDQQSMKFEN